MSTIHSIRSTTTRLWAVAGLAATILCGCGGSDDTPPLGSVHGTVTLDGNPLPDATVRFQPTEGGRIALATTDTEGYYELQYSQTHEGAVLGKHVVRIHTGVDGYDDGETVHPPVPEKVPTPYNRDALDNPEMNVEIKTGNNQFDFNLTSEGDIVQPAAVGELPGGGSDTSS